MAAGAVDREFFNIGGGRGRPGGGRGAAGEAAGEAAGGGRGRPGRPGTTLPMIFKDNLESASPKRSQSSKSRFPSRRNAYLLGKNGFRSRTKMISFSQGGFPSRRNHYLGTASGAGTFCAVPDFDIHLPQPPAQQP